jgi:Fic family protein
MTYVLDLATKEQPVIEAWTRELHRMICGAQQNYKVYTPSGIQDHELPLGEYKRRANHVRLADGSLHSYAPVAETPFEMQRLTSELESEVFQQAHPVHQASYAHYALVAVHPFADGNGRVARALASVFSYRSHCAPVLITNDRRTLYFDSLAQADRGVYQTFVDFVMECALDAVALIRESLRTAQAPEMSEQLDQMGRLYRTRGGFRHEEVDQAGATLFQAFHNEIQSQLEEARQQLPEPENLIVELTAGPSNYQSLPNDALRWQVEGRRALTVSLRTQPPTQAKLVTRFEVAVPKDCDQDDEFWFWNTRTGLRFTARITELSPKPGLAVAMRIRLAARAMAAEMVTELLPGAEKSLSAKGY